MNRLSQVLVILAIGGSISGQALAHGSALQHRHQHQERRIDDGIQSGELTRRETGRLMFEQKAIEGLHRRFTADGELSPRERYRLHSSYDAASRHIYRLKHNEAQRY